jgi:integrase
MTTKITDQTLPPGKDEHFAWDPAMPGFGLRLRRRKDGSLLRKWIVQFRNDAGRTRRIDIGSADRITPAQARKVADQHLANAKLGKDPQAERAVKRAAAAITLRSVIDDYLAAKQPLLRPASFRIAKLYLLGPYFAPLHTLGVSNITRANVAARLTAITARHSANTSAAARKQIAALFVWAMEEGLVESNPVDGTRPPARPQERDRVLTDAELAAIWNAGDGDGEFARIIHLLVLLGSRRTEVGGMRWSELDLEAGTWTLPKERSKNHHAFTISLPPAALAIIKSVAPRAGRDHLFGEVAGFQSWARGKTAIDERLGDKVQPWTLHDIRRTVATGMADIGVEPHHIEAVLNHHGGHRAGVAGVYNRSAYVPQIRTALLRWSEHLLALVEGRKSNVLAFTA